MYISDLVIDNYRSLKEIKINNMLSVCIFHGLNNSGKSNILSALESIFKRKLEGEIPEQRRPIRFWRGYVEPFRDNFFNGDKKDITFSVNVVIEHDVLERFMWMVEKLSKHLNKPSYKKELTLNGSIRYIDEKSAYMELQKVSLNTKYVIMEKSGNKVDFFPKVKKISVEKKLEVFEGIMELLNDAFIVIPSNRYLTIEKESGNKDLTLSPDTFKQWLFNQSLDRTKYSLFQRIKEIFNGEPFEFGELSFERNNDEIEIMVEKNSVRLPINRMGSGLQQILFLISNLVLLQGKMLGIEELEINLSPTMQKQIFEKFKSYLQSKDKMISQIIITSHSHYFGDRGDVRCYETSHDGDKTIVANWTEVASGRLFRNV